MNSFRHETIPSAPVTPLSADATSPLSPNSAYFTTSEGKARFLTRYSRDVATEELTCQEDAPAAVVPTNSLDLRQKKVRLVYVSSGMQLNICKRGAL
jgi:protein Shroom